MIISSEYFEKLINNVFEGVYIVDENRTIIFWNESAEKITGFTASEVLNRHCFDNILRHTNQKGDYLCLTGCPLHATLQDGMQREISVYLHHKDGHRVPVTVKTIPFINPTGVVNAIEVFKDDSEQQNSQRDIEQLKALSITDPLTKLPNRRYIENVIHAKMNEMMSLGLSFGVVFIDIDRFKNFNDTYGHETGDKVLQMIAATFKSNVRSTDIIGRWGGEEFVGALSCKDESGLYTISEKLRVLVEQSCIDRSDRQLKVTISVGATMFHLGDTLDSLIRRADELMYQSKQNGRNRVTIG